MLEEISLLFQDLNSSARRLTWQDEVTDVYQFDNNSEDEQDDLFNAPVFLLWVGLL